MRQCAALIAVVLWSTAPFAQEAPPPPPAVPAAPAAAPAPQSTPAPPATADEEYGLRMKQLETSIAELKEQIFRSKAKLTLLTE